MQGPPSVPDGTLVYAIGDLHGRADLLGDLLARIESDAAGFEAERRVLLFVGDYVDRGPDSAGVIERLSSGLPNGFDPVCLKGNHEDIMLDFLARPEALGLWLFNGAAATLASYGVTRDALPAGAEGAELCRQALTEAMPAQHRAFLDGLRLCAEIGDYFFAHAGVRPGVALDAQEPHDLVWIREGFLDSDADFGKVVVHGHTPRLAPEVRANRIDIDTGAWQTGILTALRLHRETRGFLATGP